MIIAMRSDATNEQIQAVDETHLPVIIDPSHAGGKAWMVPALARAATAAGADGLLVEMHPQPSEAWCDADQALSPQELNALMEQLRGIARVAVTRFIKFSFEHNARPSLTWLMAR